MTGKRLTAGLLCAVFALALCASSVLILHEADHDCAGEDCAVCRIIADSRAFLRFSGAALLLLLAAWAFMAAPHRGSRSLGLRRVACPTPVQWKIRLNN